MKNKWWITARLRDGKIVHEERLVKPPRTTRVKDPKDGKLKPATVVQVHRYE